MNALEQTVAATLRRYLSEILAASMRSRAQAALGVPEGSLRPQDLPALCRQLEPGVRLFVDPAMLAALNRDLAELRGPAERPRGEQHPVLDERDVSVARMRARELALVLGGSALGAQRAATATSELARNIVSYAGRGSVELVPADGLALTIVAIDRGPGIPDVDLVLSGKYRSRTGLGKGLLGVKRLARRFHVESGPTGTRVEAEIAL